MLWNEKMVIALMIKTYLLLLQQCMMTVRKSNSKHAGVIEQSLLGVIGTSTNENNYSGDKAWDMMRYKARCEAEREPLLEYRFCLVPS